ncbi:MAG: hypothetical protein U0W24_08445 [Bacteroidales bacterium]
MDELEKNSKEIGKFLLFFIVIGIIEIIVYVFIFTSFFAIIPGLITVVAALNSFNKITQKRKYFIGIWSLIKYNPIGFALYGFFLGDLYGTKYNSNSVIVTVFFMLYFALGALSDIFGIILIFKIAKQNKLIKFQIELK